MKVFDFTETYLRSVLGFLGMIDITAFRLEGLSVPDLKDNAWNKESRTVSCARCSEHTNDEKTSLGFSCQTCLSKKLAL